MNIGDIGWVETCFVPWTLVFKAVGKHKYTTELIKHITNVHFFYPEGLKRAVWYSMLLQNLYTKTVLIVPGLNRTIEAIIKESVLINIFCNAHLTLEKDLVLSYLSTHHADPDMTQTYATLEQHMSQYLLYTFDPARKSAHQLQDMFMKGFEALKQVNTSTMQVASATVEEVGTEGAEDEHDDKQGNTEDHEHDIDDKIYPDAKDISIELDNL
ncbi:uncharacterized protein PHACADRAFT_194377 [Phanerochaete carnosa HHB-10118-sp]|uniref:DUF6589 domain-containing protein n=1 Tax=Phanerochaete carnosa (strain HHB-10118-sp) TaxID=650164 RepID=K5WC71_PHACS|nr:uncharacterized protein PHACADRAFT_194377 [Phanerochaete carnosa HHB-10118-sp]EKM56790.1 hypothetical protein PHACADRAFT_194377 [Phanerochaete carnosa HHB-10118-sp]